MADREERPHLQCAGLSSLLLSTRDSATDNLLIHDLVIHDTDT